MPSEFINLFLTLIFVLSILVLLFTGVDVYFNQQAAIPHQTIFKLNILFVVFCGLAMLVLLFLNLTYDTLFTNFFSSDRQRGMAMIVVSLAMFFPVKIYLHQHYGLKLTRPWLITGIETASLLLIPYIGYRFLVEFGKAFKH